MSADLKIEDEDLYEILEVDASSSIHDIKKAYRKKALKLHPDKNPDNPNASLEFHKLSKILEILTDESARKAYDKVLKARKEAALRHRALDSKRQRLKENLEAREKSSVKFGKQKSAEEILREEIERLRKEGSKQVEEEIESITRQIRREKNKMEDTWNSSEHRIKIRWKAEKGDPCNGGYDQQLLHKFLSKYGDISVLIVSSKKNGSALVEFNSRRGAEMAVELEKGLATNPLQLEWLNKPACNRPASSTIKDTDYESLVLMKMRQAEERKKLIEQMIAEDNDTDT
ncbi:Chaperone [Oryctes borbonicus]|uniref:Chaperone n=1 Tax=Oryctes borbonicus TaxID=1629725 RepID=A0A0T6AYX5_9SCAR|nr:Chaperone [Oryctes borbonicus]